MTTNIKQQAIVVSEYSLKRCVYNNRVDWEQTLTTEAWFDEMDKAREYYDSIDLRDIYITERSCSKFGIENKGYVKEIALWSVSDGELDCLIETYDYSEYTHDHYIKEVLG